MSLRRDDVMKEHHKLKTLNSKTTKVGIYFFKLLLLLLKHKYIF